MKFTDGLFFKPPQLPECTHRDDGRCEVCQDARQRSVEKTAEIVRDLKEIAGRHHIPLMLSSTRHISVVPLPEDGFPVGDFVMQPLFRGFQQNSGKSMMGFNVLKNRNKGRN